MKRLCSLLLLPMALLTGCRASPQINVLGSFFPAWMLSIGIGIVGTLLLRRLFVRTRLEPYLGVVPLVYFCLCVLVTLASWLVFFRV
jgi:hypothetical protein